MSGVGFPFGAMDAMRVRAGVVDVDAAPPCAGAGADDLALPGATPGRMPGLMTRGHGLPPLDVMRDFPASSQQARRERSRVLRKRLERRAQAVTLLVLMVLGAVIYGCSGDGPRHGGDHAFARVR